jgi:ABC-type sugar transport system permease subunit
MQQTDSAQPTTTSSPDSTPQVSIAVPIEQAPAAQQQSQTGSAMAWILVAAAVAAAFVFKKLNSNDPSQGGCPLAPA